MDRWGLPALLSIDAVLLAIVVAAPGLGYRDRFKGTDRGSLLGWLADHFGYWRILFVGAIIEVALWPLLTTLQNQSRLDIECNPGYN
ncbi:MAG: hypothetical protein M1281_11905 [Chloroflexi bacterium]|nr:hypothetical protein [Chloroflexota bacterium]